MKSGVAAMACLTITLLTGCVSGPTPPDWQGNVLGATERATEAYLTGRNAIEVVEFARARKESARTGKIDLIARVELLRCATRVASLVFEPCEKFDQLAADSSPEQLAYAEYLEGRLKPQDASKLPEAHRDVIKGGARALQAMSNPLSKLVGAGVLFRMSLADPAVIALAIETASTQGWNRPLLAWLSVHRKRAEMAGDTAEAARIQRSIDLVLPLGVR
jgi:hypothetical protein